MENKTILGMVQEAINAKLVEAATAECPVVDVIEEGEIEVGEMTVYEKAILLVYFSLADQGEKQVEAEKAGQDIDENEHWKLHLMMDFLRPLLWLEVKKRFGCQNCEGFAGFSIRPDWKIVGIKAITIGMCGLGDSDLFETMLLASLMSR